MESPTITSQYTHKRYLTKASLWVKIILPYFILTMLIAGAGTYVLTNLFTSSLQDRINNQLIDAGRIVSEGIVDFEEDRLQTLRIVANTEGVPQAVAAHDADQLAALIPQILINNDLDNVEIIDMKGIGIYGWQQVDQLQGAPIERLGTDWSSVDFVNRVLAGEDDTQGDKFTFISESENGLIIYTIGPIILNGEVVGAVMIGSDLRKMTFNLTLNAVARVTFYDQDGNVLETSLTGGQDEFIAAIEESPEFVEVVIQEIERNPILLANPGEETPYRNIDFLGQSYQLAYGEWRLRGQKFGIFSVGVPRNQVEAALQNGRNLFVVIFSVATAGVFVGGLLIAGRITKPIRRLVDTATAVTDGNLTQRSGIEGEDEIGKLATAFDTMTDTLAQRNRQLLEQASKLEAIVDSIADGVIVIDTNNDVLTVNPAANALLADMSHDFFQGPMRELSDAFNLVDGNLHINNQESDNPLFINEPQKYLLGNRVLSARAAPVRTPNGDQVGSVIVLRDVTREVETDERKDAFITSVSHELRTPLAVVKLSSDLIKNSLNGHSDERLSSVTQNLMKGIEELEHLINQLINISEIQAGTLRLNKLVVPFNELVQQINELWQPRYGSKNVGLSVQMDTTQDLVNIDISHLSWAIDNLIENALHYTPEGGQVNLRLYDQQGYVGLDVIDNGIGIAAADQPHLFDRFFRAHNQENYAARGVGLGLYITRSIVELHNGFVSVESESGQGSIFTIMIPMAMELENEPV